MTMSGTVATVTNDKLQQLTFRYNNINQLWYLGFKEQEPPLTSCPIHMFSAQAKTNNRPDETIAL
jgi:hypothetical protein